MTLLSLLPAIVRRRPGRIELTISPATRLLYVVLGFALVLTLVRDPAGSPFAVMFAVVISLAALSEDRWTFDAGAGEMRRRFGVLFLAKSWAVGLDTISSIKVDAEFLRGGPPGPLRQGPARLRQGPLCAEPRDGRWPDDGAVLGRKQKAAPVAGARRRYRRGDRTAPRRSLSDRVSRRVPSRLSARIVARTAAR